MNSKDLKNNILQKISQIEDETFLQYIQEFLIASDKYYNKNTNAFHLTNESDNNFDYTNYIKEWVKDM